MIKKPTKRNNQLRTFIYQILISKHANQVERQKRKLKKKKKKGKTFLTITHEIVRSAYTNHSALKKIINELQKVGVIQRIFLDYNVITLEKLATKIALFK